MSPIDLHLLKAFLVLKAFLSISLAQGIPSAYGPEEKKWSEKVRILMLLAMRTRNGLGK